MVIPKSISIPFLTVLRAFAVILFVPLSIIFLFGGFDPLALVGLVMMAALCYCINRDLKKLKGGA